MEMSYRTTNILKGICLVFMFIHHFFTFPEWYLETISYPYLSYFASHFQMPFKICVCVFAFLTGYFFASKKRSFKYCLTKIIDFLISYWLVCIPFIILAYIIGDVEINFNVFVDCLFGFDFTIMCFSWYVYFYITIMLFLPIVDRFFSSSPFKTIVFGILVPCLLIRFLMNSSNIDYSYLNNVIEYLPTVICGYCLKYHYMENVCEYFKRKNNILVVLLSIVISSLAFVGKYYMPRLMITGFNADILYAPLFVISVTTFIDMVNIDIVYRVFEKIGKNTLVMWNFSALFFSYAFRRVFQPILFLPKNPLLVLIWGLAICYVASLLITKIKNLLYSLIINSSR